MSVPTFLKVISLEAKARMSYRLDFWASAIIGFVTEFAVLWFLWNAIFEETKADSIAGFDSGSIYVYYLAVILIGKIIHGTRFTNDVSQDIYQGNLNKYIIFPVHYISFKYAQYIGRMAPGFIQFLLFALVSFFIVRLPDEWSPSIGSFAMGIVAIFFANVIYFLMDFLLQLCAFWIGNVWSLHSLKAFIATTLGGYMFPLVMFPQSLQTVLEFLPFKYLYSFPVNVLFGRLTFEGWIKEISIAMIWCVILLLLCEVMWKKGRLKYTGVGI